jgi:predicted NUDIX family NTP pyrophosphohydrolase
MTFAVRKKNGRLDEILVNLRIPAGKVEIENQSESSAKVPPLYSEALEDHWAEIVEYKNSIGTRIWNSDLYRLEDFKLKGEKLLLKVSTVETKAVLVFCRFCQKHEFHEMYWPKNMFVAGIVETSDSVCLFGRLSGKTLGGKGKVDMLGGALSKQEIALAGGRDLETALLDEFNEEFGVTVDQVESCWLRGLVLSEVMSIGVIFEIKLGITHAEVLECFEQTNDDELSDFVAVPYTDLSKFLAAGKSYFPAVGRMFFGTNKNLFTQHFV